MGQPSLGDNQCEHRQDCNHWNPYRILNSRRTLTALYGVTCLTFLGVYSNIDTSLAIASITAALAGSNAFQKRGAVS